MRAFRLMILGVALLMVGSPGQAQEGGGGFRRGAGRFGGDPNEMFNRMANGQEVINRSEITDPRMLGMFDRMAERMGITNGQITRQQFVTNMQERMAQGSGGGMAPNPGGPPSNIPVPPGSPPPAPGAAPGGGDANNPENWDRWADSVFRRMDQNGDGVLNYDEMSEDLRSERDKWDTDHNGLIDLNEFKVYFTARMQQRKAEWSASGGAPGGGSDGGTVILTPPPVEEEPKPVVYRAGKLPKELPAWFQQLDTDNDGQIGLYEWKAAGRPLADFDAMDRNKDGFLTIQEVLSYVAQNKHPDNLVAGASAGGPAGASGGGNPARFGPPPGRGFPRR